MKVISMQFYHCFTKFSCVTYTVLLHKEDRLLANPRFNHLFLCDEMREFIRVNTVLGK